MSIELNVVREGQGPIVVLAMRWVATCTCGTAWPHRLHARTR